MHRAPGRRPTTGSPQAVFLSWHGTGVGLVVDGRPDVLAAISGVIGAFVEPTLPGLPEVEGVLCTYRERDVLRTLSPRATRIEAVDPALELYRDGERLWLVDERWGMAEVNLLRRSFRSWILPGMTCDAVRLVEAAVLWPMAQVLRPSGLHLLPGAAASHDGRGILLLSPTDLSPEVTSLASAGVGVIGQRWVTLREERGGVSLLWTPGLSEVMPAASADRAQTFQSGWADLCRPPYGTRCFHARCTSVLVVDPVRRPTARVEAVAPAAAARFLTDRWPMPAPTASGRTTDTLVATLAARCAVYRARRGRAGDDLAGLLVKRPADSGPRVAA